MNVLEISKLRKSYGDELVLENIDITVAKHQVKVVIGASGCGKSTLLRTINLLEDIDDGQVFLDGQDISAIDVDVDEVRSNIGSVFQSFNLFPHLTVLENITLAPRLVHGIAKDVAEKEALELLTRFNHPRYTVPCGIDRYCDFNKIFYQQNTVKDIMWF